MLLVGRHRTGLTHAKLRELIRSDLFGLDDSADELSGYDACFYCVGVTSAGMSEADYRRVTLDLTVAVVGVLTRLNPAIQICFVSGLGTDSSASSSVMWARVKGAAENHLLGLPQVAYMLRPGFIQRLKGVTSRTKIYRVFYALVAPVFPLLKRLFPNSVTTSVNVGRAMIRAASTGADKRILETRDINELAEAG